MRRAVNAFIAVSLVILVAPVQAPADGFAPQKGRAARRPAASSAKGPAKRKEASRMQKGLWGGQHISLNVTDAGARIEYDCGRGTIDSPIRPDAAGRFTARGTHTEERGGPVRAPDIREAEEGGAAGRPARYKGRVREGRMTLTVTLADTGEEIGTFSLAHGREPLIVRCY